MPSRTIVALVLAVLFSPRVTIGADAPPNFIIVFCDDLGYGDLGCFGHPTIRTPNLDRMAEEGQRWTNFYVGASICTPSRAALLTGRLPIRSGMCSDVHGVLFPRSLGGLPAEEITIAEVLREQGYATGCVGKWHLGHLPQYLPTTQGFDSYWGIPYSNDMDQQPGFPGYHQRARSDAHYMATIEQFNVPILSGTQEVERPANQHTLTERYTQHAIDFIHANKDQPFFLYLAHNLPHIPLFAGDAHVGSSRRGLYGDVVQEIDAGVGRIRDTLDELDLSDNTLIVFTSDNGPWRTFGTHGGSAGLLRAGKGTTFEGGMREPTIFCWPGHVPPGVQAEMGATMDLLPTFAALADAEYPDDRELDGYDLSAVLTGKAEKSPRDRMFYWRGQQLFAVRQGPWKAHFVTRDQYEGMPKKKHEVPLVYHLEHDPGEKYDVAAQQPEVIEQLTALADAHRGSIEPVKDQLAEWGPAKPKQEANK